MIENFDKSSEYTQKLFKIDDDIILEIELESLKDKVPIITREVLNFMLFEAERIKAKNILEIGTATGFSGVFLAQIANRNSGKLTTIEIDEARYKKAKENFKKLGLLEKNGTIFIDNIMFRGIVAGNENEIPKRYKTIVKRLKEFINELNEKYNFVLLPFGDGVGLVRKI